MRCRCGSFDLMSSMSSPHGEEMEDIKFVAWERVGSTVAYRSNPTRYLGVKKSRRLWDFFRGKQWRGRSSPREQQERPRETTCRQCSHTPRREWAWRARWARYPECPATS